MENQNRFRRVFDTTLGNLASMAAVFLDILTIVYYLFTWKCPKSLKFRDEEGNRLFLFFEDFSLIQKILAVVLSLSFVSYDFFSAWNRCGTSALCCFIKFGLLGVCAMHVFAWMVVIIEYFVYHTRDERKSDSNIYQNLTMIAMLVWSWLSIPFVLSTLGFAATCEHCAAKAMDKSIDCDRCYTAFMWIYELAWFFGSWALIYIGCMHTHSMINRVSAVSFGWFTFVGLTVLPVLMAKCDRKK